jgi:hypothetical protein
MKTFALFTGLLVGISSWGSINSQVIFHGSIIATNSELLSSGGQPAHFNLSGAQITIMADDEIVYEQRSSTEGAFALVLDGGAIYTMTVSALGYLTRTVTIDTTTLPDEEGFRVYKLYGDLSMISTPPQMSDNQFEDTEMAWAEFNHRHHRMEWDEDFARSAFTQVVDAIKLSEGLAKQEP